VFKGFSQASLDVVASASEEAERQEVFVGLEHLLVGLLGGGGVSQQVLEAGGLDLDSARERIRQLAADGSVRGAPPDDAAVLREVGITLPEVRRAAGQAAPTRTRRARLFPRWRFQHGVPRRVCEAPIGTGRFLTPVTKRALQLAETQSAALGSGTVEPEHLLLGLLAAMQEPPEPVPRRRADGVDPPRAEVVEALFRGAGLTADGLRADLIRALGNASGP
jgi:hypothetical protein